MKCNFSLKILVAVCPGEKALRQILDDARKIADKSTNRQEKDAIMKNVGDMESMANALSELRQQGKVVLIFCCLCDRILY